MAQISCLLVFSLGTTSSAHPLGKQGASEKTVFFVVVLALCQTTSVFVFLLVTHLEHTFVTCIFFFFMSVFVSLYGERSLVLPYGYKEKNLILRA